MSRNQSKQSRASADAPGLLPVTVVAGFFGAGKSALIRHLLAHRGPEPWALLVNDRSDTFPEHCASRTDAVETFRYGETMVELTDQCMGCSFRQSLTDAIVGIARLGRFDRLIVECSGLTEPVFVAEVFNDALDEGGAPASVARLDQLVTVVDAATLWENIHSSDDLQDRGVSGGADDTRSISELLIDQIEQSTLVVLNKQDRVTVAVQNQVATLLQLLNPEAPVLRGTNGVVSVEQVLAIRPCWGEPISFQPGWLKMVEGLPMPAARDACWSTGLFRAARPFHPGRFWQMIEAQWPGVLRAKGYFWLASQPDRCMLWAQTAGTRHFEWIGKWWMATPESEWPSDEGFRQTLQKDWTVEFGDRRQVLAFTGYRADLDAIFRLLRACLLTPSELLMGEEEWKRFEDPFALATQEAGSFAEDSDEEESDGTD